MNLDYDPADTTHRTDPFPMYRTLRDEAPVHWAPKSQAWCVSRYEDVHEILRTPSRFASGSGGGPPGLMNPEELGRVDRLRLAWKAVRTFGVGALRAPRRRSPVLIGENGEAHARRRDGVNRGFTKRRVQVWEKRAAEVVAQCMDQIRDKERFDLVQDLNIPLPVTIISEVLGIESERHEDFKRWSDQLIVASTGSARFNVLDNPIFDVIKEMRRYITPIARQRKKHPEDDLISTIVQGRPGEAISEDEVFLFVLLLLVAGNETTTNLIGNAVHALLDHPEQLAAAVADPELVPAVVEEALRFDGPVQSLNREVVLDTEIAGTRIPKGSVVTVMLGSGNRDERRFPDPDTFDLDRDTRGHLGLGFGVHFCLGASLARLEAKAALEALIPELPRLERVSGERTYLDSQVVRGVEKLELRRTA